MKIGRNTLQRRADILESINSKGKITVNELSKKYNISDVSIRNDLSHLEKKGLLIKTRGGAIKAQPVNYNLSLSQRVQINLAEKQRIGKQAMAYVEDGYSIVIDSGSTAQEVARNLIKFKNITLITNSLSVADICRNSNIELIMTGGELRREMRSLSGPLAENTLHNFNVDIAFIGADSISPNSGIFTPLVSEASLSRAMIEIARKSIVVVDSSKFDRKSLVKISDIHSIDTIITDDNLKSHDLDLFQKIDVELILV